MRDEADRFREWNKLAMEWGDWDVARRSAGRAHETLRVLLGRAIASRLRITAAGLGTEFQRLEEIDAGVARHYERLKRATLKIWEEP